jgi:hypothetical protein
MTKDEEIKSLIRFMKQKERELAGDPQKSRQWLIKLGILDKTGKRLARRYR